MRISDQRGIMQIISIEVFDKKAREKKEEVYVDFMDLGKAY